MRRILEVLSFALIVGGVIFGIGTAGSSDCNLLTFSQMLYRVLSATMIIGTGIVIAILLERRRK